MQINHNSQHHWCNSFVKPLIWLLMWMPYDPNHLPQTPFKTKYTPHLTFTCWWQLVLQQDNAWCNTTKMFRNCQRNMAKRIKCRHGLKIPTIKQSNILINRYWTGELQYWPSPNLKSFWPAFPILFNINEWSHHVACKLP